jgi:hypothetical protein
MNTLAKKDDKRYKYFIYKLYNPDCNFSYVGSTRDMTTRKSKHKSSCNNVNDSHHNLKVYKIIREHDGFENWYMVVIEVMPNVTKLEAEMKEDAYRMQLNATMNSKRASCGGITLQEYRKQYNIDNKETIQQYKKQYRIDNKESIQEKHKQYYIDNKEVIIEHSKQHYIDNKEKILTRIKQYQIDNKETISAKKKQKHNCDCGGKYVQAGKSKHMRTKKHQIYISNNNL